MSSWGETSSLSEDFGYSEIKKPPVWPLVAQVLILASSLVIFILTPSFFRDAKLALTLFAYILSPFVVVALQAILRASDLKNRSIPWYDKSDGKSKVRISGFISLFSFFLSIPILWRLASEIAARVF